MGNHITHITRSAYDYVVIFFCWLVNSQTALNYSYRPTGMSHRQHCAKHKLQYLVLSWGCDFEVFRPAGATCWTDGGDIWYGSPEKRKIRRIDSHCQYELMHFRLTSDDYRLSLQSVCNGFIVPFSTAVSCLCLHWSADSQSQNR